MSTSLGLIIEFDFTSTIGKPEVILSRSCRHR